MIAPQNRYNAVLNGLRSQGAWVCAPAGDQPPEDRPTHLSRKRPKLKGPHPGLRPARLRDGADTTPVAAHQPHSHPLLRALFVVALLSMAAPLAAVAADPASTQHRYPVLRKFWRFLDTELRQKHLTGDWGGRRHELERAGVTLTATYTTDLLGNPVGGNQQGFRYTGDMGLDIRFDLEKLSGLEGLLFDVSGSWRSGEDLSAKDIGNTFTASQIFGGETVRLYALALEWPSLLDNRLDIRVGRIGAGDDFLASPLYIRFVNFAFNSNPGSVPTNIPSFSTYPVATWGLRAQVTPVEPWSVTAGLYYSDPTVARNSAHGVDFSIRNGAGVFVIGELGYLNNRGKGFTSLPGNYKIGAYVDSNRYQDLSSSDPVEVRGNYGLYLLLDQMVYREDGAQSSQGLTPFATLTFAPSNRNTFPLFFSAGLTYLGPIPGHDDDTAAFGLAYGKFSKYLSGQRYEMVLEWTYAMALTPWLTLQPDVQYVINPSGMSDIADALVLGVQIAVNF
jgi:porin